MLLQVLIKFFIAGVLAGGFRIKFLIIKVIFYYYYISMGGSTSSPATPPPTTQVMKPPPRNPNFKKVLLLGLDDSGKTSFAKQIVLTQNKSGGVPTPVSTIGMDILRADMYQTMIFDMGGGRHSRSNWWGHIHDGRDGILYFVDVTTTDERLKETKNLLIKTLELKSPQTICWVLLSKIDLTGENRRSDEFWRDWCNGTHHRKINCMNHGLCHFIMKEFDVEMTKVVKDYVPPPPQRDVEDDTKSYTTAMDKPKSFCERIWS